VWAGAGACAGELLGLRGGLECSDLDYLRSALDGKRGALERQPTKHVRTHTHKLKPLGSLNNQVGATVCGYFVGRAYGKLFATSSWTGGLNS